MIKPILYVTLALALSCSRGLAAIEPDIDIASVTPHRESLTYAFEITNKSDAPIKVNRKISMRAFQKGMVTSIPGGSGHWYHITLKVLLPDDAVFKIDPSGDHGLEQTPLEIPAHSKVKIERDLDLDYLPPMDSKLFSKVGFSVKLDRVDADRGTNEDVAESKVYELVKGAGDHLILRSRVSN